MEASKKKNALLPLAMLCELTHACPLSCSYCSNPLKLEERSGELSTEKWFDVFEQARDIGVLQVHFSGGEPGLRKDLEELNRFSVDLGLYTNLITSGVSLTEKRISAMAKDGLSHVQISIQDSNEKMANWIGGNPRGYKKKFEIAAAARKHNLSLTINAPIHRINIDHIGDIIDMAVKMDAHRLEVAHVQYYGWAYHNRHALMPKRSQLMKATEIVEKAVKDLAGKLVIDYVVPDYYARRPKACMGGWGRQFFNISPSGKVLPCHAAESITDLEFDTVRDKSLLDIWNNSPAFQRFRGTEWMPAKCRGCPRKEIDWAGCRCQAFAITGSASNMDPACEFSEHHQKLVGLAESDSGSGNFRFEYRTIGIVAKPSPPPPAGG